MIDRKGDILEKLLQQILDEIRGLKEGQNRSELGQNRLEEKLNLVNEQTANLTEFRNETRQNFSDIKDTLKFLLHKGIETEKEVFALKESC